MWKFISISGSEMCKLTNRDKRPTKPIPRVVVGVWFPKVNVNLTSTMEHIKLLQALHASMLKSSALDAYNELNKVEDSLHYYPVTVTRHSFEFDIQTRRKRRTVLNDRDLSHWCLLHRSLLLRRLLLWTKVLLEVTMFAFFSQAIFLLKLLEDSSTSVLLLLP